MESAIIPATYKKYRKYKLYYFLALPGLCYFIVFHYIPMFGILIAFKDIAPFNSVQEILQADWVGFKYFLQFFDSYYFWNVLSNTVVISFYKLLFGFPAPILFALLLNEIRHIGFKRIVQTISYLPHFLSMVIVSGLVMQLLSPEYGLVNWVIVQFGGESVSFLSSPQYFRTILVITDIWQSVGWGSILYLAAMAGVDPHLYEAATIDGASRWRQMWHITLPGISFVIAILLILSVGRFMDAGFEQIFLLYSAPVYRVADIIDTYVYRQGLLSMQYSFATAIGVFKNVIGMMLIFLANYLAKRLNQQGLW